MKVPPDATQNAAPVALILCALLSPISGFAVANGNSLNRSKKSSTSGEKVKKNQLAR
ncbi:MAG: hypothetical protein MJE68_21375 [Proteobacteria bacterium]|nr:hypothetical protein [Pseudomonadota bacterium]